MSKEISNHDRDTSTLDSTCQGGDRVPRRQPARKRIQHFQDQKGLGSDWEQEDSVGTWVAYREGRLRKVEMWTFMSCSTSASLLLISMCFENSATSAKSLKVEGMRVHTVQQLERSLSKRKTLQRRNAGGRGTGMILTPKLGRVKGKWQVGEARGKKVQ